MIKYRLYFDKDEETKWLNEMSEKGWAMKKFFAGCYFFEQCEKGKYIYQVDFGNRLFAVSDEYKEFMQEMGVEIVQTWGYWVILRKLATEGNFELYTDVESSIEHYKKIRNMFKMVTIIEFLCMCMEIIVGIVDNNIWGFVAAFILAAILIALVNVLIHTNNIIHELKERTGEADTGKCQQGVSALLPCGMLINACVLMIQESISSHIKITIQIIAIILMLAGIHLTCKNRKQEQK